jgi:hypothetical protein
MKIAPDKIRGTREGRRFDTPPFDDLFYFRKGSQGGAGEGLFKMCPSP